MSRIHLKCNDFFFLMLCFLFLPPAAVCQAAGGEGRDPRHPGGPHQGPAGAGADPERAHQGPQAQVGSDAGEEVQNLHPLPVCQPARVSSRSPLCVLRHLIIENFIPSEEKNKILNRSYFDEDDEYWKMKPITRLEE